MQKEKVRFFYLYVVILILCMFLCLSTDLLWMNLLWLCKGFYSAFDFFVFIFRFGNSNSMIVAKFFVCIVVPLQAVILYACGLWGYKYSKQNPKKGYCILGGLITCLVMLTVWQTVELSSININYSDLSNGREM